MRSNGSWLPGTPARSGTVLVPTQRTCGATAPGGTPRVLEGRAPDSRLRGLRACHTDRTGCPLIFDSGVDGRAGPRSILLGDEVPSLQRGLIVVLPLVGPP